MTFFNLEDHLLVMAIFVPLERIFALRPGQPILRRLWQTDALHFVVTGIVIQFGIVLALALFAILGQSLMPGDWVAAVRGQPIWLQAVEVILVADFGFYCAHRTFHAVPFLWRVHSVHHSIEELDWLAAHRVHPLDQILTKSASFLPVCILGFSPQAIVIFAFLYHWQSLAIHSNIKINLGVLSWLVATPRFHHWHHANSSAAANKNFSAQMPLFDLLFGTFYLPKSEMPLRYGVDEPVPQSWLGQILYPFNLKSVPASYVPEAELPQKSDLSWDKAAR